jgi:hypothetical protein
MLEPWRLNSACIGALCIASGARLPVSRREDIDNAIWGDPVFEGLSVEAKLLYLWSFTNPLCGMAGLYRVSPMRMQRETGLTAQRWAKATRELQEAALVFYERSWLWCRSRVKYLRTRTPNMATSIMADVGKLDPNDPLRHRFVDEYVHCDWLVKKGGEAWQDFVATTRAVEPNPAYHGHTMGEGSRTLQGTARAREKRTTTTPQGEVDSLPDDLDPQLQTPAGETKRVLDRVFHAKGGTVPPTLAAVGRAVASFPRRDHVGEAEKLEHWLVHGSGRRQANKDVVARYRTWLERADEQTPPAKHGRVDRTGERLAEAMQ